MIAFVKTYENEYRKMRLEINEVKAENQMLKTKLNSLTQQKRRPSTSGNT